MEQMIEFCVKWFSILFDQDYIQQSYPSRPDAKPKHNLNSHHVFSDRSKNRLNTAHPDLIRLAYEVLKYEDHTILEGHRDKHLQNRYYKQGKSQLEYPRSKHNKVPSKAIDVAPYPIDWKNIKRFKKLGQAYKREAKKLRIQIVWGGDWKTFKDYPHIELR